MKKYILLFFASLTIGIKSEAQNTKTDSEEAVSKFKVEINQTGKYTEYQRLLTLSSGMVYEGTSKQAIVLHDGDLKDAKYSFVTTDSLDVFEPSIQVGWYGNKKGEGQIELKIYKNNVLIDTQKIYLKPENSGQVQNLKWTFKATR